MPTKKIHAGRVITVEAVDFIGEKGTLFYNEALGDLRLSDGVTPGGRLLNHLTDVVITDLQSGQTLIYDGSKWVNVNAGTIGLSTATSTQLGGVKVGSGLLIDGNGSVSIDTGVGLKIFGDGTVSPA